MLIIDSPSTREEFTNIADLFVDTFGEDFTWAFYYNDDLKLYFDEVDEPVDNLYLYLEPFEVELLKNQKRMAILKIGDILIGLFPSKDSYEAINYLML